MPARYFALLTNLAERTGERRAWLGDVGFRIPGSNVSDGAWAAQLTDARWRGMHPELMPFAEDGFGNLFCFVRSERPSMRGDRGVVYWMYETYRAVPIASSFDAFLNWTALTSWVAARRGDPVIDDEHFDNEILPVLDAVGIRPDVEAGLETSDPDPLGVHHAVLRLDPEAPGARVAIANWLALHDRPLEALDMCAEALFAFPDFAGARAAASRILVDEGGTRLCEALVQTLQRPLVYGGDEAMPFLRDIPPTDIDWTVTTLAAQQEFADLADDPLWTLVTREDPTSCHPWIQLAIDYANDDVLDHAATAACNALFVGFNTDLGAEIHGLLSEIYAALGWSWHAEVCARWAPR